MDVKAIWQQCHRGQRLPLEHRPHHASPRGCQASHGAGRPTPLGSRGTLWTLFSMPTVHAETATATDRIEHAEKKMSTGATSPVVSEMEVQQFLQNEMGADRIRRMFSRDHMGNLSPELATIKMVVTQSGGISFLLMSLLAGRNAKEDFVHRNQLTVFKTRFMAFRKLQDTIFMRSVREGTRWCLRVSFFSGIFLLVSQSIAVYRNKSSPLEYVAAGAASGAVVKTMLGPKAMFAGGVIGGVFGIFAGLVIYGMLNVTSETQEQRHYWQIQNLLEQQKIARGEIQPSHVKAARLFSAN